MKVEGSNSSYVKWSDWPRCGNFIEPNRLKVCLLTEKVQKSRDFLAMMASRL